MVVWPVALIYILFSFSDLGRAVLVLGISYGRLAIRHAWGLEAENDILYL